MKRVITTVCLIFGILFAANNTSYAQLEDDGIEEENIDIGIGLAYGSELENLGITADAYYGLTDNFRIGGNLIYFFPEDAGFSDINWFSVDLNGHYFFLSEEEFDLYGLAGLNMSILSYDTGVDNSSDTALGLNLGGGVEYGLDFADLFGELTFAGIGGEYDDLAIDGDQIVLRAGLRFNL